VKPGGPILVMDQRVPHAFTGPGDPVGNGTVMRPDTLRG
jgi:hypothetical protein